MRISKKLNVDYIYVVWLPFATHYVHTDFVDTKIGNVWVHKTTKGPEMDLLHVVAQLYDGSDGKLIGHSDFMIQIFS